jgi:hypothetical protein
MEFKEEVVAEEVHSILSYGSEKNSLVAQASRMFELASRIKLSAPNGVFQFTPVTKLDMVQALEHATKSIVSKINDISNTEENITIELKVYIKNLERDIKSLRTQIKDIKDAQEEKVKE